MSMDFSITPSAQARIKHLLSDEPQGSHLRVSVLGGGCSGFQYRFDFDPALAEDDKLFGDVVVDEVSLGMLGGSVLDYTEDLGGAAARIVVPLDAGHSG